MRFLMSLASSGRFKNVIHYFPLRGHSFNDCDSDFATVKRRLRREDRIYTQDEYVNLIQGSSKTAKFAVHKVDGKEIIDFKKWWPQYYKKQVLSDRCFGKGIKG